MPAAIPATARLLTIIGSRMLDVSTSSPYRRDRAGADDQDQQQQAEDASRARSVDDHESTRCEAEPRASRGRPSVQMRGSSQPGIATASRLSEPTAKSNDAAELPEFIATTTP